MLLNRLARKGLFLLCFFVSILSVYSQQFRPEIQKYLQDSKSKWGLTDQDIVNWRITDQYTNKKTGVTYTYLNQEVSGVKVFNAVSTLAIKNGRVVHFANRFIANANKKANSATPTLRPDAAIQAAAKHLGLNITETPKGEVKKTDPNRFTYNKCGISKKPIELELVYVKVGNEIRLAWNVNIAEIRSADWWNVRIDAQTGKFIEKNNWTVSCALKPGYLDNHTHYATQQIHKEDNTNLASSYNVFAFPLESPSFGPRTLLTNPENSEASPYGWHDTDSNPGAEYTITRGNNVYAYEDQDGDDFTPGYSPDGGPSLVFDYPLDLTKQPTLNSDAIITNLFYLNNAIHDILYNNGFDEASGNFQANNYGKGGQGDDYVLAEAQDGGGTSNANFSTPGDGQNGVMQMYLWPTGTPSKLTVNIPSPIAGEYTAIEAAQGGKLSTPLTADAVLMVDGVDPFTDGCEALVNGAALAGKIAVVDRGLCIFTDKIAAAENAGALALVIINNQAGSPISIGGDPNSQIPTVMISQADGLLIREELLAGKPLNITLSSAGVPAPDLDGSLDNGIVAHEYGHGVSNRLTAGSTQANCLYNGEQGGEGWSDWLAMILTIEPNDKGTDYRGIGTYALGQKKTEGGIRRYPYSTDKSINPQTYADLAISAEVHDIGEIWSQTLWDMSWKIIDKEGFDSDLIKGNGGNNTAIKLVLEGMKLQPCSPGFIDGRNAILAADDVLFNSIHRCDIWEAFAGRGMGFNADQGDSDIAGDETANFDLPSFCLTAVKPPVANFSADTIKACFGEFNFKDLSTDIPQEWHWNFGDGQTSNAINPTHTYDIPGTYTVTLTVKNTIGEDSYSFIVVYAPPATPTFFGELNICEGNSTKITANVSPGNTAEWLSNGNVIYTGDEFITPVLLSDATYEVRQTKDNPVLHVGPIDNKFSTGGYHNNGIEGRVIFEAFVPFRLKSVLVYANGEQVRTFNLYKGSTLIQTIDVLVPDGESRVTLNFDIPEAGNYSASNPSQNLWRNNAGADYPYVLPGIVSLNTSNATTNDPKNYYYYLYDWEVQEVSCHSPEVPVNVNVSPGPVANFDAVPNLLSVQFSDLSTNNPTNWSWDFGDGSISNQQNPTHNYTNYGTYKVVLSVTNGTCVSTHEEVVEVKDPTGVFDPQNFGTKLYPNPASNLVNIELSGNLTGPIEIKLTDEIGQVISKADFRQDLKNIQLNTSTLSAGVYYVQITGKEGHGIHKLTLVK